MTTLAENKTPEQLEEAYLKLVKHYPYEYNIFIRFKAILEKAINNMKACEQSPTDIAIPVESTGLSMATLRSRMNDALRFGCNYLDRLPSKLTQPYTKDDYDKLRRSVHFRPMEDQLIIAFKQSKSQLFGATNLSPNVARVDWKAKLTDFITNNESQLALSGLALTADDQAYVKQVLANTTMEFRVTETQLVVVKG